MAFKLYKFSRTSLDNLVGVDPDLVDCVHDVMAMQIMDFSVIEGVRSKARQKDLVARGVSKTMDSKHLIQDDGYGHAVDLYPYPINMPRVHAGDAREIYRFGMLAGLMLAAAKRANIKIVNGADWDGDGQTLDHSFFDAPHFQLVKP